MLSERTRQENNFVVLRRIVLTLVTRSGRPSGFNEDRLNTLIHMIHVSVLDNWQIRHLHSMAKIQK